MRAILLCPRLFFSTAVPESVSGYVFAQRLASVPTLMLSCGGLYMTVILVTYVMPSSLFSAGGWARGWMTGVKMMMIPMRI